MNTDKIYAESIVNEYSVKETSKVIALKKLDRKAKMGSDIFAYTFGTFSTLILGIGICFSLNVFGSNSTASLVLGIILGILGIIGVSINYLLYKMIHRKGMEKYANDIIMLANDISERA